jgi:hypothetical protein
MPTWEELKRLQDDRQSTHNRSYRSLPYRDISDVVAARNQAQTRPADPLAPLTRLTEMANFTRQGLSDAFGPTEIAEGFKSGDPWKAAAGVGMGLTTLLSSLAPPLKAGGMLRPVLFENSYADMMLGNAWNKVKGALPAVAAGGAVALDSPTEAEGGVFRSGIQEALSSIASKVRPGRGWLNEFSKKAPTSSGELRATGLDAFLDTDKPVLKKDIEDYLSNNPFEVDIQSRYTNKNEYGQAIEKILSDPEPLSAADRAYLNTAMRHEGDTIPEAHRAVYDDTLPMFGKVDSAKETLVSSPRAPDMPPKNNHYGSLPGSNNELFSYISSLRTTKFGKVFGISQKQSDRHQGMFSGDFWKTKWFDKSLETSLYDAAESKADWWEIASPEELIDSAGKGARTAAARFAAVGKKLKNRLSSLGVPEKDIEIRTSSLDSPPSRKAIADDVAQSLDYDGIEIKDIPDHFSYMPEEGIKALSNFRKDPVRAAWYYDNYVHLMQGGKEEYTILRRNGFEGEALKDVLAESTRVPPGGRTSVKLTPEIRALLIKAGVTKGLLISPLVKEAMEDDK